MAKDNFFFKRRGLDYHFNDGVLEVRLKDNEFHTYFKKEVGLTDKKGIIKLMNELKDKGITFPQDWLD